MKFLAFALFLLAPVAMADDSTAWEDIKKGTMKVVRGASKGVKKAANKIDDKLEENQKEDEEESRAEKKKEKK